MHGDRKFVLSPLFSKDLKMEKKKEFVYNYEDKLRFGKYKGRKIKDILFENPEYLVWCDETIVWFKIKRAILNRALDRVLELERKMKRVRDVRRHMTQESNPYWSEALQDNDY